MSFLYSNDDDDGGVDVNDGGVVVVDVVDSDATNNENAAAAWVSGTDRNTATSINNHQIARMMEREDRACIIVLCQML
jgi:hypothetical protein